MPNNRSRGRRGELEAATLMGGGKEFHEQARKVLMLLTSGAELGRLRELKPGRVEFWVGFPKHHVKVTLESWYEPTEENGT